MNDSAAKDLENIKDIFEKLENLKEEIAKNIRRDMIREWEKLEKILITITTGSLVLSATFVINLMGFKILVEIGFLLWSWSLLITSLICMLIGYIAAVFHFEKLEKDLFFKNIYEEENIWKKIADWSNRICLICTIFGIIYFTIFAFINIYYINLR